MPEPVPTRSKSDSVSVSATAALAIEMEAMPWVTFGVSRDAPTVQWVDDRVPLGADRRSNRLLGLLEIVRGWGGAGLLPRFPTEDEGAILRGARARRS